jgi:hypothetical protein
MKLIAECIYMKDKNSILKEVRNSFSHTGGPIPIFKPKDSLKTSSSNANIDNMVYPKILEKYFLN